MSTHSLIASEHSAGSPALSTASGFYYRLDRGDMLRYVPPLARRVLDVGCGAGRFGALVKERTGAEVWGAELNSEAATAASRVLDRVFVGDFTVLLDELPNSAFDCIAFNDVLEHLADPFDALRRVRRVLAPDGVVIASIPNVRYFRALKHIVVDGDFKYEDYGIFDRTHLRFFTRTSIIRMFSEAGYRVQVVNGLKGEVPRSVLRRGVLALLKTLVPGFQDIQFLQFAVVAGMSSCSPGVRE